MQFINNKYKNKHDLPPPLKFVDWTTLRGTYTVYTTEDMNESDEELD